MTPSVERRVPTLWVTVRAATATPFLPDASNAREGDTHERAHRH
jgi:hypothetical protein